MPDTNNYPTWPGWETVRVIGRGSYGAVYEIRRDVFGETEKAAMKVISIPQNEGDIRELYNDGYDEESITSSFKEHLKSIVAEYSLMRKLNGSANVVNCDDMRYIQHSDGIGWDIFIKMELLTPLSDSLPAEIPPETAVRVGTDLCRALVHCRQFDIVHRDIKPQNIFLSPLGDYKLGDFGIAKTVEKTSGGTKIGTYKYMAPEVYNNRPYGAGADIYSLGLVLYWLLNKRRMPFLPLPPEKLRAGMEEAARLRRFQGEELPPPVDGSEELKRIVLKACAYDPKDRYQSAEEMLHDLENVGRAKTSEAQDRPVPEPEVLPAPVTVSGQEASPAPAAPLPEKPDADATVSAVQAQEKSPDPDATLSAVLGSERKAEDVTVSAFDDPVLGPVKPAQPPKAVPVSINPAPKKKKGWVWGILALAACVVLLLVFGQTKNGSDISSSSENTLLSGIVDSGMSSGAGQTIPDGDYIIRSCYQGTFLDIWGADLPARNHESVQIYSLEGPLEAFDIWTVHYVDEGGFYEICQMGTDMVLEVADDSLKEGASIQVSQRNGESSQKWSISPFRAGFRLQAKCSGYTLDFADGYVQQRILSDESKSQCWLFVPYGTDANISWSLDKGVLTLSGTGRMTACDMVYDRCPWFDHIDEITSLVVEEGITEISENAFMGYEKLASVQLPESLREIGFAAFDYCPALTSIKLPDGLTVIHGAAFSQCNGLKEVYIPANVAVIEEDVFGLCENLLKINVAPDNQDYCSVDGVLFSRDMTELCAYPAGKTAKSYEVPDGVSKIGSYAFHGCRFTHIHIPDSVTEIGENVFTWSSLTEVFIPTGVVEIGSLAGRDLNAINVSANNPVFSSRDGVLFSKNGQKILEYPCGKKDALYTIPDGVTEIGPWAFWSSKCKQVTLPESLRVIRDGAFAYSGLTQINLHDKITAIERLAFCGCSGLKSIALPSNLKTIPDSMLYYCDSLSKVYIPASVRHMEEDAFSGCSALKNVYFSGTKDQWQAIVIDNGNDPLNKAKINYNSNW